MLASPRLTQLNTNVKETRAYVEGQIGEKVGRTTFYEWQSHLELQSPYTPEQRTWISDFARWVRAGATLDEAKQKLTTTYIRYGNMASKKTNTQRPVATAPSQQLSPHHRVEAGVMQVAETIAGLDEKTRVAAELLGPRLQRHLSGQSVMDEVMGWIANNGGYESDLPELDTAGFDTYLLELKDAGIRQEDDRAKTRDRFTALMAGIDERNELNLVSLRESKDSLQYLPSADGGSDRIDAYALPEAWDGEVNAEEGRDDG